MVLLCCLSKSNFQKLLIFLPPYVHAQNASQLSEEEIQTTHPDLLIFEATVYNQNKILQRISPEYTSRILLWGEEDDQLREIIKLVKKGLNYLFHPVNEDQILKYLILKSKKTQPTLRDVLDTGIIGSSQSIHQMRTIIKHYGKLDDTVTITGETGTGKDITARALHKYSDRSGPFIAINCAAIPETLIESEMFGSVKGAYTDSVNKIGYFEAAQGGTLFLDEIGEMPLFTQSKLLRIIEDKQLIRVGSTKVIHLDVRIICATSRNMKKMMEEGHFRKDLYYRLNILKIDIPPLRHRKKDIPLLCRHIMEQGKSTKNIHPDAMMKLLNHPWPGNVRELKSILRKAEIISMDEDEIEKKHIEFF